MAPWSLNIKILSMTQTVCQKIDVPFVFVPSLLKIFQVGKSRSARVDGQLSEAVQRRRQRGDVRARGSRQLLLRIRGRHPGTVKVPPF